MGADGGGQVVVDCYRVVFEVEVSWVGEVKRSRNDGGGRQGG